MTREIIDNTTNAMPVLVAALDLVFGCISPAEMSDILRNNLPVAAYCFSQEGNDHDYHMTSR